jgi:hypothetical protein
MTISPETIEEYFERYEWSYTRSSEDTWITGVRTAVSSFRIFVRVSEHWVYFVINPFVVGPSEAESRLRLYYHILRYNLDMNMAKFGLDSDGDVFLAVELPTENFDYSHFADALNGISHHAERLYSDIFNLAHNSVLIQGRYDEELDEGDLPEGLEESAGSPLDDYNFPEDLMDSNDDLGPIIAGKEVRIVDDEDGNIRVEFQTAHDLDDEDEDEGKKKKKDTSKGSSSAAQKGESSDRVEAEDEPTAPGDIGSQEINTGGKSKTTPTSDAGNKAEKDDSNDEDASGDEDKPTSEK